MHDFHYKGDELFCEEVSIQHIAEQVGTPCYIYSHRTLIRHFHAFDDAFQDIPHIVAYAMKANSNIAVLKLLAKEGSGADIVSGGELFRALKAGVPSNKASSLTNAFWTINSLFNFLTLANTSSA